MTRHVMLDLETLGTRPGCVIRSVGACSFELETTKVGAGFYRNVTRESCEALGLHVDPQTEAWWAQQSDEARAHLEPDQRNITDVVEEFHAAFRATEASCIWCHGATFDVPIWDAAAHLLGLRSPWKFYDVRDTRTLFDLANFDTRMIAREGTHHNALDDAIFQAKCVQAAYRKLRN